MGITQNLMDELEHIKTSMDRGDQWSRKKATALIGSLILLAWKNNWLFKRLSILRIHSHTSQYLKVP